MEAQRWMKGRPSFMWPCLREPGNSYTWAVSGGTLLSGQGTSLVTVEWTTSGAHSIQVVETNDACTGGSLNLDVEVHWRSPCFEVDQDWTVWPNPAQAGFRMWGQHAASVVRREWRRGQAMATICPAHMACAWTAWLRECTA